MSIPYFQMIMHPLLCFAEDGNEHYLREAIDTLSIESKLSENVKKALLPSDQQSVFHNRNIGVSPELTYEVKRLDFDYLLDG